MNSSSIVKIKKKISVTDLSGEKVMIDFDSGKYYMLKGTGNDIWDLIQKDISVSEIIERLCSEYEVSSEECSDAVIRFLAKLQELNFIECV